MLLSGIALQFNMTEMGNYLVRNNIHFRHGADSRVAAHELLRDGLDLVVSKVLEVLDLPAGNGVKEHSGVHGGAEKQRLLHVPGTSDACEKIITNS